METKGRPNLREMWRSRLEISFELVRDWLETDLTRWIVSSYRFDILPHHVMINCPASFTISFDAHRAIFKQAEDWLMTTHGLRLEFEMRKLGPRSCGIPDLYASITLPSEPVEAVAEPATQAALRFRGSRVD